MQGCLAITAVGFFCWLAWDLLRDIFGSIGWFWGIIVVLFIIGTFLAKK